MLKIAVASEHRGFQAKSSILIQLREMHFHVIDFGTTTEEMCDYPDVAAKAAGAVSFGDVDRAILVGGTGIGMTIVANKFRGVRAALCHDELSARISRTNNDANVLCLAADLFDEELACRMIKTWLETNFDGGRHARRNQKIAQFELKYLPPIDAN